MGRESRRKLAMSSSGPYNLGGFMKRHAYPKTLYVAIEYQGKDECLLADVSYKNFAKTDVTEDIAIYKLVRVAKAKNTTVLL
jgi:hypothetical protein